VVRYYSAFSPPLSDYQSIASVPLTGRGSQDTEREVFGLDGEEKAKTQTNLALCDQATCISMNPIAMIHADRSLTVDGDWGVGHRC
jgi:hypothetical protein